MSKILPSSPALAAAALLAACATLPLSVHAQSRPEAGTAAPLPASAAPTGHATRAWLQLQRSGEAAGSAHPIPGEIAAHGWKRWADSFRHPIPESFAPVRAQQGAR